ncbi:MAG: site-specific integrase [Eubacterium sp.]|nr:site-specific integrase [Eubacterium sp.]
MVTKNVCTERMTFADALEMWLTSNRVRIKHTTYDKYNYIIQKHITPNLGDCFLSDLNAMQINSFLNDKLRSGSIDHHTPLAPSYVSTMSLIISSALHFAANENWCADLKNPIYKPSAINPSFHLLSRADYRKLTEYLTNNIDETGLGILLALYTGLRIGEICALEWKNVDFKRRILHIDATVSRINNDGKTEYVIDTPKTKSSWRDIPIPRKLAVCLQDVYNNRAEA